MSGRGVSTSLRVGLCIATAAAALAIPVGSAAAAGVPGGVRNGGASPAAAACATPASAGWRTTASSSPRMSSGTLRSVAAGGHPCFDRFVMTVRGSAARTGFYVGYVRQITQEGSGIVVPTRGAAKLLVVARAPAYDARGRATYQPRNPREMVSVRGFTTFRQVVWAGSFEGQTSVGLGVRAMLPYRAFVLKSGTTQRLVVDVAHAR